jgi:hypothetical protein
MTEVPRQDLLIIQGATFRRTFNWYGGGELSKAIEGVTEGYPTILQITGHGLPSISTTPVFIRAVKGAIGLNTGSKSAIATYIDANSFSVNLSTANQTWVSGTGFITYYVPTNLTGYTARMHIRSTKGAVTTIHEMTSVAGDISLTAADGGIHLLITAADTAAFDFDNAVYDLELINTAGNGDVVRVAEGVVKLHKEVTR